MLPVLLSCAPLCVLAALLLSGRYLGEERILRRLRGAPVAQRTRAIRAVRARRVIVRSRLECTPLSGRGPPLGDRIHALT